jgi:hypothetical protein
MRISFVSLVVLRLVGSAHGIVGGYDWRKEHAGPSIVREAWELRPSPSQIPNRSHAGAAETARREWFRAAPHHRVFRKPTYLSNAI